MDMISAIILAKNEENSIGRCLSSVSFCDDVIVIDDNSTDKTVEIAKKMGATVVSHPLNHDFATQRNFAMTKAKYDWILFVDADEVVSQELAEETQQVTSSKSQVTRTQQSYYLLRRDFFWNKELKYGETQKARNRGIIRLVKKGSGKWVGKVHEEFVPNGDTAILNNYLNHYPHPTINDFLRSINDYSSKRAEELQAKGVRQTVLPIIFNPIGKFIYTYFIRLGFLDGPAGFVYSFMMSFHSFLVRGKLYLHQQAKMPL